MKRMHIETYIATSEVTALEHELGDDAVEGRVSVSKALLASAESTEVLGGLGDDVVVEGEVDAAGLICWWGSTSALLRNAGLLLNGGVDNDRNKGRCRRRRLSFKGHRRR
jgi:hypothetical protein